MSNFLICCEISSIVIYTLTTHGLRFLQLSEEFDIGGVRVLLSAKDIWGCATNIGSKISPINDSLQNIWYLNGCFFFLLLL